MSKRTQLKSVRGITVNTVHGDELSIMKIVHRLNPQVSMEGAAGMLACQKLMFHVFKFVRFLIILRKGIN